MCCGQRCQRYGGGNIQHGDGRILLRLQLVGLLACQALEAHAVAGLELAGFPQLRLHDGGRAHKAAEAGAVRAEDHRHVTGEINGADGIGVVVNVGRMQACLAAVAARPLRRGADQAHAGARRVVMHLPWGGKKRGDAFVGEKIRRAVRAIQHADFPIAGQRCAQRGVERFAVEWRGVRGRYRQHIARAQRPPAVPAKLAEREGGFRAEIIGHVDAATHGEISAQARAFNRADAQHAARGDAMRLPWRERCAVERGLHRGAGERDHTVAVELERRSGDSEFQRGRAFGVAGQAIGQPHRQRIHRPRRWHAHVPIALASRPILHGGLHARRDHVDGGGAVVKAIEETRGLPPGDKVRHGQHLCQIGAVGFDAGEFAGVERGDQRGARGLACVAIRNQLGQHRIIIGRHHAAALHPAIDTDVRREMHCGQQPRRGLKILVRVFGIEPRLYRSALGPHRQCIERRQITRRKAHHPLHQIYAGDRFGDAVLHLQARVHLQKIKFAAGCVIDKFHRAGGAVTHGAAKLDGDGLQPLTVRGGESWRRGFLDHFLIAPLHRAIAFAQRDHGTPSVAEQLHLDVTCLLDVFFEINAGLFEIGARQPVHRGIGLRQLVFAGDETHADAAAARRAFQHYRITNALRLARGLGGIRQQARPGQQRHAVLLCQFARGVL